jgi:methionyl-tRNA formyltransferase
MIVGYFADGPWSHRALDELLLNSEVSIAFICARYDHQDPVLRLKAKQHEIPFFAYPNVNDDLFLQQIKGYRSDLFVSMSFNQIFRKNTIEMAPLGAINCHAGKLPFYRGRNILNWALINDEKEFGVTVHYVDEGIDTGDIIRQECFPITDKDDYRTLLDRAYHACGNLLAQSVEDLRTGNATSISQQSIHPMGFYCPVRGPGDERLNWNQTSRQIFNFVRAICPPGPSARCYLGAHEIKINKVEFLLDAPNYIAVPGAVLSKNEHSFLVKTADSYVRVLDWQAGKKIKVGDRLT